MATVALLLAAAVAIVEIGRMLREVRRHRRLNGALHELRRPLQAIAMAIEHEGAAGESTEACLTQARRALEDLDAVVNGNRAREFVRRASIGEVVAALEDRWRFADVEVEDPAGDHGVDADVDRLGAALDNLVANALRHGSGVVSVRVRSDGGRARFEVRDDGPGPRGPKGGPRHGHGLGIAAGTAAQCGGSLSGPAPAPGGGTIAAISLPVTAGGAEA